MCKLRQLTHKLYIKPQGFTQFVSESTELHIEKIYKNKIHSYIENDVFRTGILWLKRIKKGRIL